MDRFSSACTDFGMTISLKKTTVLLQGVNVPQQINIGSCNVEAVDHFVYLGSKISSSASMEAEITSRIGKASGTFARLSSRVWDNPKLSIKTKAAIYRACVCSTLLYGSETWTLSKANEKKLNTFHFRCLRRILHITWQHKISNEEVLKRTGLTTMYTTLSQYRLRWLGHVRRMEDGRIPKDLLYGELVQGKRNIGRPTLRFKDTCKRDMKTLNIDTTTWEEIADDRSKWRSLLHKQLKEGEEKLTSKKRKKH
jgi:hypothetical protein